MKNCCILRSLIVSMLVIGLLGTSALAIESDDIDGYSDDIGGYVYNTATGELQPYKNSPDEVLPEIQVSLEDMEAYSVELPGTRSIARGFVSYSPFSYVYKYSDPAYKIGRIRVDNSNNKYSSADLVFTVQQSSSCGIEVSASMEYGAEANAIFGKVQAKFGGEVATNVSWTRGTTVGTNSSVPPGKVGSVTAYVIGIYTGGTGTYRIIDTSTDEMWEEEVPLGALVPTTNDWNLVVEIS